ncbi:MAG: copper-binding protein, partial [Gemmatimonadetes bacterium]|nr:copper-binding protein [Gemmatimonadota bacterium]
TPEPSPDVSVDIAECAGVVDIGWVDSNTNPVAVQGFDIQAGIITFGNDRTDRWAALPALMKADEIVETFHRVTGTGDARYRWKRPQNRASRLYPARGVVRSVHRAESRVVIDHEDIPGLMKAMTMGFEVPDRALLEGLGPGQGVEFEVEFAQGRYRIVAPRTRTN